MNNVFKDLPIGFHRLNRTPLDDSSKFNSNKELLDYLKNGTVYDGQIVHVKYNNDNYQMIDIVKLPGKDNEFIPRIWPIYNTIFKKYNGGRYALVYCFMDGIPFESPLQCISIQSPFNFSLLPLMALFALTTEDTNYIMQVNDKIYEFNQPNFIENQVTINDIAEKECGITSFEDNDGYYSTNLSNISIMSKKHSKNVVKLYVKANKYYSALGWNGGLL